MSRLTAVLCATFVLMGAGTPAARGQQTDLDARIEQELPSLVATYQAIHAAPELSHYEKKTSALVAARLRELGFEVTDHLGKYNHPGWVGYGVVGVMKNGAGPTVLVRTELDALPITEETGLPYASHVRTKDDAGREVGVMHACGHDIHITTFLGTAKLLAELKQDMMQADAGAPSPKGFSEDTGRLARLIQRDPTIRVAFLALGGWDTHISQGAAQGQLAGHLRPLAEGLALFQSALGPAWQETVVVVISEFGRTMHENGNAGTDHGHGNVMWVMGGPVRGAKVYGKWPGLQSSQLYQERDLAVTTDFREPISLVLRSHMGRILPTSSRLAFVDLTQHFALHGVNTRPCAHAPTLAKQTGDSSIVSASEPPIE